MVDFVINGYLAVTVIAVAVAVASVILILVLARGVRGPVMTPEERIAAIRAANRGVTGRRPLIAYGVGFIAFGPVSLVALTFLNGFHPFSLVALGFSLMGLILLRRGLKVPKTSTKHVADEP